MHKNPFLGVALPNQPGIAQQGIIPVQIPISGYSMPGYALPFADALPPPIQSDEEVGQEVLSSVESHETKTIGQLAKAIREKLDFLDAGASLTGEQWKAFAELSNSIKDLIGK